MSVEFKCGDPAGLAGYLYDESDAAERAAIEAHLAMCPSCAEEVAALGATRTALASWAPPDAALGFRITSAHDETPEPNASNVLRPVRWWQRPMPAWAQAAAAILIFAAGAALGLRSGGDPTNAGTMTGGSPGGAIVASRAGSPAPNTASAKTASANAASAVSAQDLAALEQRLRSEMTSLRKASTTPQTQQASSSDDAVLQRVRALLAESEQRQQRELALRVSQVLRDVDTQRRQDLMRIEQTFGQMEGFTGPELANQRQMINYLIQRTGAQRPQ